MSVQLTARNATAQDLVAILNSQKAEKLDLVVPATSVKSQNGLIVVRNAEPQITEDGVTTVNGTYRPTEIFDEGLAGKLGIPVNYLRTLRNERPDLYDSNVNGWLHGRSRRAADGSLEQVYEADQRAFLLRLFRQGDGDQGVARAFLSDRYSLGADNLDVLTAALTGIREAGVNPVTRVTNLSERGVRVRFEFPDINTLAPDLLNGYKSPFDGPGGATRAGSFDELRQRFGAHHIFKETEAPIAYLGVDFGNSETGGGAFFLNPVIGIVRCTNGLIVQKEGIRRVHLGGKLAEGNVTASSDTLRKEGALIAAQARDAVVQWLKPSYLETLVKSLSEKAQVPLASVTETVPAVTKGLGFTQEETQGVLDFFIQSGQLTSGGVAQAISAYAQTVQDPDRAYAIELQAIPGLEEAARIGSRA